MAVRSYRWSAFLLAGGLRTGSGSGVGRAGRARRWWAPSGAASCGARACMPVPVGLAVPVLVLVVAAERQVDADEGLLLVLAQRLVGQDQPAQIGRPVRRLEDAGLHVEGLGGDAQRLGDLLEDLGGGPPQSPLDLAEIRIGDAGQLGEPAQREAGGAPLLADERAQISPAILGISAHFWKRSAARRKSRATTRRGTAHGPTRGPPGPPPGGPGWSVRRSGNVTANRRTHTQETTPSWLTTPFPTCPTTTPRSSPTSRPRSCSSTTTSTMPPT